MYVLYAGHDERMEYDKMMNYYRHYYIGKKVDANQELEDDQLIEIVPEYPEDVEDNGSSFKTWKFIAPDRGGMNLSSVVGSDGSKMNRKRNAATALAQLTKGDA